MDDITFDTVARAVAAAHSRRGALQLLGGVISLVTSLSGMLWPASLDVTAENHKNRNNRKKDKKKKHPCEKDWHSCGERCCPPERTCCGHGRGCCSAGAPCCSHGCCGPGQTCCGNGCCETGRTCCGSGETMGCCPLDQGCFNWLCCTPCGGPNGPCCELQFEGGICCQGMCHLPCPEGTAMDPLTCRCECYQVLGLEVGTEQACCPSGQSECGGQCCPTCGCEQGVCTNNWYMCGPEGAHSCCFQGYVCCPDQPFCCNPGHTCNPTGGCQ